MAELAVTSPDAPALSSGAAAPSVALTAAAPAPRLHIRHVDGMRAVAALIVFVNHAYAQVWNPGAGHFPTDLGRIDRRSTGPAASHTTRGWHARRCRVDRVREPRLRAGLESGSRTLSNRSRSH